jgi:hypothetical protein
MLSGCLYKRNYLKYFTFSYDHSYHKKIDLQAVTVKALTNEECLDTFDVDLVEKGYIPLFVSIDNNSPDTLSIRPSYVDIIPCSPQRIAKLLHYDTSLYTCGLCLPGLLFWWPALIVAGSVGYDMYRANHKTNERINECVIQDQPLYIRPYEKVDKFIFVHEDDYKYAFKFKIFNEDQHKILIYNINLGYCSV